jgi:two-component system nitrogen regulation response regulator GlnG
VLAALDRDDDPGPQVLVSDIRMPGGSGLDLLEKVKAKYPGLPVIIMTAYSDLDSAVSAFQGGAFEYLPKPFDLPKAVELIHRAVEESQREEVAEERMADTPEMLGQAPAMQDVFRAIGRLSQSNVTVMITGESGSGKELVARALHKHSPRAKGPFVAINTAAIPKDLLESELFGHERGAFTGAQTMRRGRFEQADGGTLFLDEIGDMPFDLQTRLLRVLSDGHFYRVGGHSAVKTNVRVIAATHQNLEQRVKDGAFREDLFHRLNVIRLRLPALRERKEDVPMLTRHFLQQSAAQLGVEPKRISDAALAWLGNFGFPGNVRQLENICHWLTVMAPAQVIEPKDLPPEVTMGGGGMVLPSAVEPASTPAVELVAADEFPALTGVLAPQGHGGWEQGLEADAVALLATGRHDVWDELTRRFESRLILAALAATRGRRIEAAQKLGIGRNTITRKIQELGLE